jgi:ATP-dependent helicase/nuclease subunit A
VSEIKLTPAQRQAVEDRGGALLVSASAGSGKTKVLVERLFSYMEREGCRVDDFLIITYTRAAAAELRGKIAAELSRRVAERPDDAHLRRQLFRVYQADIKTVDAFCAALLRENVHLLPPVEGRSLTPDFRVLDEQESELLRLRVLQRILEDFYQRLEAGDDRCELLAETLGAGRDDRKLEQLVLELHGRIQSHAYPGRWLRRVAASWETLPEKLEDTAHGRVILADTVRRASFWARRLRREADDLRSEPSVYDCYAPVFRDAADSLDRLAAAAESGDWAAAAAAEPTFASLKAVRDPDAAVRKEAAQAVWNRCKEEIKKERAVYRTDAASWLADLRMMAPAMLALVDLTERFALAYQAEKVRRNVLDFSDQEHYAVELLVDGEGEPTELARRVGQRYREVMVDEFQDTNEVQNWIFRAVSGGGRRLFAVGDVKQSIYRFRLADPTIFLEKYRSYRGAGEAAEGEPRRILLQSNFRSRAQILDAANFVFAGIMSRDMGEMDYGADEELRFGADYYSPRTDADVEFHLISVENTEDETFDRDAVEAGFIARRVRQLLDEGCPVRDGDAVRPVRPEDIVILMRSPRARLGTLAAAMARENVPFAAQEDEDFFSSMEVAVMISFLEIIDNPRQDVPLIAVLRSPLFGFTADDLARIRGRQSAGDFYDALCLDDAPAAAAFRALLTELRRAARELPADRLLWRIYTDCHAMAVFGAMEGGEQRKSNLIALFTYAGSLAASGKGGLFDFITFLRGLLDRDKTPAVSARRSGGGVRLMSIHKSKGLEFPVVILADLQRKFNEDDLRRAVLVHPDLGLGPECVDRERRIRYDTVSRLALAGQLRREKLAEEMRVLYVAMTRAKEKLILVDCMRQAGTRIRSLASLASYPADPEAAGAAKCPGDWILLPLLCAAEAGAVRRWAGVELPSSVSLPGWQIRVWENPAEERAAADGEILSRPETPFDPALLERRYAHERAALIPTKVTATQLKGRELDEEIAEGAPVQRRTPGFAAPRFLRGERKLTAAERGTATHLGMQYLDFATSGEAAVAEQVRSLAERRLLTEEQAEAVDCAAVAAFLASPLARRIAGAERVWREYRFALLMPAALYDPAAADEELLLQGVADCVFDTPAGLVIVDFKTDRIRPGEEADRARAYRPQLEA